MRAAAARERRRGQRGCGATRVRATGQRRHVAASRSSRDRRRKRRQSMRPHGYQNLRGCGARRCVGSENVWEGSKDDSATRSPTPVPSHERSRLERGSLQIGGGDARRHDHMGAAKRWGFKASASSEYDWNADENQRWCWTRQLARIPRRVRGGSLFQLAAVLDDRQRLRIRRKRRPQQPEKRSVRRVRGLLTRWCSTSRTRAVSRFAHSNLQRDSERLLKANGGQEAAASTGRANRS